MNALTLAALVVWSVAMCAAAVMCFWRAGQDRRDREQAWKRLAELLPERKLREKP